MTEIEFSFESSRQHFKKILSKQDTLDEDELCSALTDAFEQERGSPADKRMALDQAFKDVLLQFIFTDSLYKESVKKLLDVSIHSCQKDICNATLPVLLLNDIFDCVTIGKCEELFTFIEDHVDTWKQELFFNNTKNSLLRMCNDLLRRLSQSQNTVFCGRILLFLAKYFPLSERSGLNVAGEFNLENVTILGTQDDSLVSVSFPSEKDEPMELDNASNKVTSAISVDYNLYRKFWSLQDFFRNPNQCYSKIQWRAFTAHSDEVMKAFSSFKLDDIKLSTSRLHSSSDESNHLQEQYDYFAKYLTNPKLLDLQLSDSNFRRCVLIQFLILFQYLTSTVKFKLEAYNLSDEQSQWIKTASERVYKLLAETPPEGPKFAQSIEHILKREEHWSHWKNEGCPEFHKPATSVGIAADITSERPAKRPRRKAGDELRAAMTHHQKILLGNASLTKLWNLCPDNLEACRSQKRDFLPSLESFFEEAIEQCDPMNMIEDEYKHVHNSQYGWRALRLLARRSPHFFTPSNQPISKLPLYLETMIKKLAKEMPQQTNSEEAGKTDAVQQLVKVDVAADGGEDSDDELLKSATDEPNSKEDAVGNGQEEEMLTKEVTPDQIQAVAEKLAGDWKKIAPLLGCEEDEIAYYESESSNVIEQGKKMLTVWRDNFGENATPKQLAVTLDQIGHKDFAKELVGDES